MLQHAKLSISMFLGVAFLVVAAPVVSRCYAHRMPVVRLMKGRRISALVAADNWKIGADGTDQGAAGQPGPAEAAVLPERPTWLRRVAAVFPLAKLLPIRLPSGRLPVLIAEPCSALGNPLRC
jgi:hypothetical protein